MHIIIKSSILLCLVARMTFLAKQWKKRTSKTNAYGDIGVSVLYSHVVMACSQNVLGCSTCSLLYLAMCIFAEYQKFIEAETLYRG